MFPISFAYLWCSPSCRKDYLCASKPLAVTLAVIFAMIFAGVQPSHAEGLWAEPSAASGMQGASMPQTITFPQPAPAYAGTAVTLNASASSGLPVTYTVLSGPATVAGSTLTFTGVGQVIVQAQQNGNATYGSAPAVQDTIQTTLLNEPVGTPSASVATVVTFSNGGTLGSIDVVTQGAPKLDFNLATGGTCAVGTAYNAGDTCTVEFTFTPTHPGVRYGGITLSTVDGLLLANSYIYASGTGPQVIYTPGTQSTLASGFVFASGVAVDSSGDVFVSDRAAPGLYEIAAGSTSKMAFGSVGNSNDVVVDGSGNLIVVSNTAVMEIPAANGVISPAAVPVTLATGFDQLDGVAVDGNGDIFVANQSSDDPARDAIYELVAVNGSVTSSSVQRLLTNTFGASGLAAPTGVAVDVSGDVYVSDQLLGNLYEIVAANGSIPSSPTVLTLGSFGTLSNVVLGSVGDVFVSDYGDQVIRELLAVNGSVPATGAAVVTLGSNLGRPQGVAMDASGNIYVADSGLDEAVKLDLSDPPSLSFAPTVVGQTSTDSPQTVTISNDGNAALEYTPIPGAGVDPTITPGFVLDNASTCPTLSALVNNGQVLPAGQSCTDVVSFVPVSPGPDSGALVTADDDLNVPGATQTIPLNGTGILNTVTVQLGAAPAAVFLLNPVTLTATVASNIVTPTGSVSFLDGGTQIGTATLSNGVGTLSVSSLGLGSHSITASYQSASGTVVNSPVTVLVEDFSITPSTPSDTIQHGGTATYTFSVSPVGGATMPAAISLAIAGYPQTSTLTFKPQTVAAGSGATSVTLTVQTPDVPVGPWMPTNARLRTDAAKVTFALFAFGAFLVPFGRRRRLSSARLRRLTCGLLLLAGLMACTALSGCGSGWGVQSYTMTLSGSSGPLSHTATLTLTSQP